jgi:hypothetical protein
MVDVAKFQIIAIPVAKTNVMAITSSIFTNLRVIEGLYGR